MNIDDTKLVGFRNEPLKKITEVFGLHLRKNKYDINRIRQGLVMSRTFSDAAIHAWIEGRNIPTDKVLDNRVRQPVLPGHSLHRPSVCDRRSDQVLRDAGSSA